MSSALVIIWLGFSICTAQTSCTPAIIGAYSSYNDCLRGLDDKVKKVKLTAACIPFSPTFVGGVVALQPVAAEKVR